MASASRNRPTITRLRRLAAALDSNLRLTAGHDLGSVWFETRRVRGSAASPPPGGRSPAGDGKLNRQKVRRRYAVTCAKYGTSDCYATLPDRGFISMECEPISLAWANQITIGSVPGTPETPARLPG